MEISDDAKARLTNRVNRIVADIDVYEAEKKEITRELTSNFYDHSMTHATERGSKVIEKQDIDAVFAESEDPKEIAAGYMQVIRELAPAGRDRLEDDRVCNRPDHLRRDHRPHSAHDRRAILHHSSMTSSTPGSIDSGHGIFVQPAGPVAVVLSFLVGTTAFIGLMVYFIVLEGRFGFTPGKWLLGLRVLKEDGTRIGYVEAIIRNIPKVVGNSVFIVIDALLMLLLFNKEKQRGFDKIARTIVVHKNKKEA